MLTELLASVAPCSVASQWWPPPSKWSPEDMPSQSGKVAVVTGANTGVGYHTALELLRKGAKVYVAARNEEKAKAAISKMAAEAGGKQASFLQLDLADLHSVKKAAAEIKRMESRVDILIANAGVMMSPVQEVTAQGYDLQFGVNVLGHACLINECMSLLKACSDKARVCLTSSSIHQFVPSAVKNGIAWDTLEGSDTPARLKMGKEVLYAQSKLAVVMLAQVYQRRYADSIVFTSCNPGNLKTDLPRHVSGYRAFIFSLICRNPPRMGALNQLYLTTMPEAGGWGGKYMIPWCRDGDPCVDKRVYDTDTQDKLMCWVEKQVASH